VRRVRREQKDIALVQRHLDRLSVLQDLENDVAFELVEKLFAAVHVVIRAAVGTADDHDDELTVLPHALISYRRLQKVPVFVNPLLEIYGWG
jgi:hypothetical protein